MWFRKKTKKEPDFDRTGMDPVLRSSICTGEQVAGFKERETGKFHEIALICGEKDLREFLEEYHVKKEELKKEW